MDVSEQITKNDPGMFDVELNMDMKNIEDSTKPNEPNEQLSTNNESTCNVQPIIENIRTSDSINIASLENNTDNTIAINADISVINKESVYEESDRKNENDSYSGPQKDYEQNTILGENSSNQDDKRRAYDLNVQNDNNLLFLQENCEIHTGNTKTLPQNIGYLDEKETVSDLTVSEKMPVHNINNEEKTLQETEVTNMGSKLNIESNTDHQMSEESKKEDMVISSLATIAAEYDSSDSDANKSDVENNIKLCENLKHSGNEITEICMEENKNIYRINEQAITSSEESDSESDSSDSSSDSSSDVSSAKSDADGSDDETPSNSVNRSTKKLRSTKETKSELDILPPIEELRISVPEVLCDPFGEVAWTVEQLVVVRPKPGKPTLNLDTILFVERGQRALGKIFDVFGQVSEPYYCVRFNSSEHIQESNIKVGMLVYYCPNTEYTSLVFLHELTKIKGTDEGGGEDDAPDFSDDEEERKYYEALRKKEAMLRNSGNEAVPHKRPRTTNPTGWKSNHPWNRTAGFHSRRQAGYNSNMNSWQGNPIQNSYNAHHQWRTRPPGFQHQNNLWCQPMHPNMPPNPNNQYGHPYFHPPMPLMQTPVYDYRRVNVPYQATQSHSQQQSYTNASVDPQAHTNTSMDPQSHVASGPGPMWYPLPPPPPPPPL